MSEDQEKDEFFDPVTIYRQADVQPPERKKKSAGRRIGAVVLAVVLLAIGFLIGWLVRYYTIDEDIRAFLWAMDMTEKYYYLDIDRDSVITEADGKDGKALMASLESQIDKYSAFYTMEEYAAVAAAGAGQNEGVGVSLIYNYPQVALVEEGCAAQKAGLNKGAYLFGFGVTEDTLTRGDISAFSAFLEAQKGTVFLMVGMKENGSDAKCVTLPCGDLEGIEWTQHKPQFAIVVENSPAQKAGVEKGMYVLGFGANENEMQSGDADAVIDFISSKRGTFYLKVGFSEDGSDAKTVSLKRAAYQAAYCYYRDSETSYSFRGTGSDLTLTETLSPIEGLNDTTAYIRIDEFSGNAAGEFIECLSVMKDRGRTHLILDLRSNGGGYLTIFQSIASHLLKNAEETRPVVASAQYKGGKASIYRSYSDSDYDKYFTEDSKLYLLADENTASASECLIGAMVDYGALPYENIYLRAQDDTGFAATYGKGIMQSFYPGSLGVMKLTVARICWPSGNCIHDVGVTTKNGAHGVKADLVWGQEDVMLNALLADIS